MTRIIERSKDVVAADFPSGKVIFNTVSYRPYILNKTASAVWDYCKAPRNIESVVRYLSREFAVQPARAEKDVKALVDGMRKRKVIRLYERKDRI